MRHWSKLTATWRHLTAANATHICKEQRNTGSGQILAWLAPNWLRMLMVIVSSFHFTSHRTT